MSSKKCIRVSTSAPALTETKYGDTCVKTEFFYVLFSKNSDIKQSYFFCKKIPRLSLQVM